MTSHVDAVAEALGHRFADADLLLRALTHPSYAHEHPGAHHYQRLEFLGDAVVGLCTTRLLFERYPDVPEGDLSDLRQRLVNTLTLGEIGREMGLSHHVRLGVSEASKPKVEPRILGDVVEALFAALFQEAGLVACQSATVRWIGPMVDALREAHASDTVKSAINRLQEFTQARWRLTPTYSFASDGPDHSRRFFATVRVGDEELAVGEGTSKKTATKHAAHLALHVLSLRDDVETT